jgi:hypothetical protein
MNNVILNSVITCRHCGFAKGEEMPIDACQFLTCRFRPLRSVEDYRTREEFVPHCSESCRRALQWEQWAVVRLMWKELLRAWNVSRRN